MSAGAISRDEDPDVDEDNSGLLGSIGFMFDANHSRKIKSISFRNEGIKISLNLKLIGEDPGNYLSFKKLDIFE